MNNEQTCTLSLAININFSSKSTCMASIAKCKTYIISKEPNANPSNKYLEYRVRNQKPKIVRIYRAIMSAPTIGSIEAHFTF